MEPEVFVSKRLSSFGIASESYPLGLHACVYSYNVLNFLTRDLKSRGAFDVVILLFKAVLGVAQTVNKKCLKTPKRRKFNMNCMISVDLNSFQTSFRTDIVTY
jgi:hypothetical protein